MLEGNRAQPLDLASQRKDVLAEERFDGNGQLALFVAGIIIRAFRHQCRECKCKCK